MGLHKQLQLPGFCMCIVKRRSYRTCLEMLGVKCVCHESAAEIQWTFVPPFPPTSVSVLCLQLGQTAALLKKKKPTVYIHSFVAASEKRGQECGCASARTYV